MNIQEAYFEDDSVDLSDSELIDFCKSSGIKVEPKGAHGLIRFTGNKAQLQHMINSYWGEPDDYIDNIKEANSMSLLKDLLVLTEASAEDKADSLIDKIAKGTGVPVKKLRSIFLGGGGEDTNAALEKLEKDGYNSGDAWFANKEWFKKHGVTKSEYDACCKLSESVQIDEGKEYADGSADFESDIADLDNHLKNALKILNKAEWKDWIKATDENWSGKATPRAAEIKASVTKAIKDLDDLYDHMTDLGND